MAMEAINNNYNTIKPMTQNAPAAERVVAFPSEGEPKPEANTEASVTVETSASANAKVKEEASEPSKAVQDNAEYIKQENEKIKAAVSEMNKKMLNNSEAVFGIHEDTNRVTIKIVDKESKKVIKELPPEKTLDMIAKAWELAGLLVDEKR